MAKPDLSDLLVGGPKRSGLGRVPTSETHSLDVEQQKAAVLNSVRRLRGQIEALERAMEQEAASSDILVLLASARESLNVVVREMLEQIIRAYMAPGESTEVGSTLSRVDTLVALLRSYVK